MASVTSHQGSEDPLSSLPADSAQLTRRGPRRIATDKVLAGGEHHRRAACNAAQEKAIALLEKRFQETGELMSTRDVAAAVDRKPSSLWSGKEWADYRRARRAIQEQIWERKRDEFLNEFLKLLELTDHCPAARPLARRVGISPNVLFKSERVRIVYREAKRNRDPMPRGKGLSRKVTEAIHWLSEQVRKTGYLPSIPRVASFVGCHKTTLYESRRFMAAYREAGNSAAPKPKRKNPTEAKAINLLKTAAKSGNIPTKGWIAWKLGVVPSNMAWKKWPEFMAEYDCLMVRRRESAGIKDGGELLDARQAEEEFSFSSNMLYHWERYCAWLDARTLETLYAFPLPGRGRRGAEKIKSWRRVDLKTITTRQRLAQQALESNAMYEDGLGSWVPEREAARCCRVRMADLINLRLHRRADLTGIHLLFLPLPSSGTLWAFYHVDDLPGLQKLLAGSPADEPKTPAAEQAKRVNEGATADGGHQVAKTPPTPIAPSGSDQAGGGGVGNGPLGRAPAPDDRDDDPPAGLIIEPDGFSFWRLKSRLTGKPLEVLACFAESHDGIATAAHLLETVWCGTVVSDEAVRTTVGRARASLRKALNKARIPKRMQPEDPLECVNSGRNLAWELKLPCHANVTEMSR